VPQLARLSAQGLDQMRMRVAETIDRDAGAEIEVALALARDQPHALPPLEGDIGARIDGQQRRVHDFSPRGTGVPSQK
jgi:hypothetical protein